MSRLASTAAVTDIHDMSLPPDAQMPTAKPRLSPEERRRRDADRLVMIRLKLAIDRELDDRGITTPAEIGAALGMPAAEATGLLNRKQWREGDVEQLEAAADRLGVQVPEPGRGC
ncbi:hypothetical protein JMJ56_32295 [Belnapia sp. T18]|uniref:XRE family transcriptional regulator n=1 Tax=Belnapia arida TaxID=2804533 RepID=A0ABS1UD77_9PROT|nr:hypothetical protein [Belnapia arida]MBL6082647.1 hypothetical protein [Belnapia arida]